MIEHENVPMTHKMQDESLGAYDPSTRQFTAPVNGRYQFSLNLETSGDFYQYYVYFKVDRISQAGIHCNSNGVDSRFMSVEQELEKGQKAEFMVTMAADEQYEHIKYGPWGYIEGKLLKRL